MMTGLTEVIINGGSFRDFATRCAGQFGALCNYRDTPLKNLADFRREPWDYSAEISEAEAELSRVLALTDEQCAEECAADNARRHEAHEKHYAEAVEITRKLSEMRKQVEGWQPPTPDHEGIKALMLRQIDETASYNRPTHDHAPRPVSPSRWKADGIESLSHRISCACERFDAEIENCRRAREWVAALDKSLGA